MAVPEGHTSFTHNVNPVQNFSKEQFLEYSKKACEITMDTLNINTCKKERKVDNPYITYELTKEHEIYGTNAEFRVLKCWNSPKALKELTSSNTARIMTAVKSDATYGSWEYGDMYFADLAKLIAKGYLKETQRDVDYSLYEWRMSIYHISLRDDREESLVLKEYLKDISDTLEAISESKMSWEQTKQAMSEGDSQEVFSFTSENPMINEGLRFLSQSFTFSKEIEVETFLKFFSNVITRVKTEHIEELERQNIAVTPESLGNLSNPQDIAKAISKELKNLEAQIAKGQGEHIAEA
tara:strand:- start:2008 stop:2895 length:888 start_codon:yes stop_codon:yes gene_type:complete